MRDGTLLNGLVFLAAAYTAFLMVLKGFLRPPVNWVDWLLIFWPWGLVVAKAVLEQVERSRDG
jgi:hypothetical protein